MKLTTYPLPMMGWKSTSEFYDALSSDYHLLYPDWEDALKWQSDALEKIMIKNRRSRAAAILDCACGIGTQALGLAERGYSVTGTDSSQLAIRRAGREARKRRMKNVSFRVADMRALPAAYARAFDVVIACDNPLAHLLQQADLELAARSICSALRPKGLVIASSRDYDQVLRDKPTDMAFRHQMINQKLAAIFQIWEWEATAPVYVNNHFVVRQTRSGWKVSAVATRMRAYTRGEIGDAFTAAGFNQVKWHSPDKTGYLQPIMTAISSSSG